MGQKGFFDVERRLEAISAKGDPLETIVNRRWIGTPYRHPRGPPLSGGFWR
jgi:hypothetical protein